MNYLDVHCHIFPDEIAAKVVHELESYYGFKWEGDATPGDLLRSMDEAGVERAIIFSSATKPSQVVAINNYIAAEVRRHADRFIGFGTMHPDFTNWRDELKRLRDLGLRGLKFHPDFQRFAIDDQRMLPIYAECAAPKLVLLFHVGDKNTDFSAPRRLLHMIEFCPGLTVIAAHLGGYSEWDQAEKYLIGKPVYLDVSSSIAMLPCAEARRLILAHGIDKVLFASDYPAARHRRAIADMLALGFSAADNAKIFHLNAERLLADAGLARQR